ncbi:MAG: amidohydrolase family protein [Chloroflexaceae bacterium]|nr:amidohydrolase family protein [Chloroflexaceae bacterium]
MRLLIRDCALFDNTAPRSLREPCSIAIEGAHIAWIAAEPPATYTADRVIDGRTLIALPGLVNAHTHSPENLLRATTEPMPLEPWLVAMYGTTGPLSERDIYLSVMLGVIEMLQSGVTAVIDNLWSPGPLTPEYLNAATQAYADSGIRAAVAPLYSDLAYEQSLAAAMGMSLEHTAFIADVKGSTPLAELLAVLDAYFQQWHNAYDGRIRCFVGPGGAQWCSDDMLHASADLARRYASGFHMHLQETQVQDIGTRQRFGMSVVQWLAQQGLLGPHVSLPHSVWIDNAEDIATLAASGACVVHNPAANLKLGSGLAPIKRMREHGIPVALGCDGSASSDNQVLFEAMRLAALIHTSADPDPARWSVASEIVAMATTGGATALNLADKTGRLEPGYLADMTLLDRRSAHLLPLNDIARHLAFCETGRSVHTVIVHGVVVVEAGKIIAFDAESILAEIAEQMQGRLWQLPVPAPVTHDIASFARWRQAVMTQLVKPSVALLS